MGASNVPKRHHYVPAFLIAQFADPLGDRHGRVMELDVKTGKPRKTTPDSTGFVKHFYAITAEDGSRLTDAEEALAKIEDEAAAAVRALVANQALTDDEREILAVFLAFQRLRTPLGQGRLLEYAEGFMLGLLDFIAGHPEAFRSYWEQQDPADRDPNPENERLLLRKFVDAGGRLNIQPEYAVKMMFELSFDVADLIVEDCWCLLQASEETTFVLSDTPVTHFDPAPPRTPWTADAWHSSPYAMNTMPVSPTGCLLVSPTGSDFEVRDVDADEVDDINLRAYGWAGRAVWSRTQKSLQDLRALAKKSPHRVPRPSPGAVVMLREGNAANPRPPKNARRCGWPRGLWERQEGALPIYNDYSVFLGRGQRRTR